MNTERQAIDLIGHWTTARGSISDLRNQIAVSLKIAYDSGSAALASGVSDRQSRDSNTAARNAIYDEGYKLGYGTAIGLCGPSYGRWGYDYAKPRWWEYRQEIPSMRVELSAARAEASNAKACLSEERSRALSMSLGLRSITLRLGENEKYKEAYEQLTAQRVHEQEQGSRDKLPILPIDMTGVDWRVRLERGEEV